MTTTTTYVKAKDISVGDSIDIGCWNGCRSGDSSSVVQRIKVVQAGPLKGCHIFYGKVEASTDRLEMIGHGRPNTTIPVVEAK